MCLPEDEFNDMYCFFLCVRTRLQRGAEVHLVPWNQDLMSIEYDGLFISNGPGDPSLATTLISNLQKVGHVSAFNVKHSKKFLLTAGLSQSLQV